MNNLSARADQAIKDYEAQTLQSTKYLVSLIKALRDEIPKAYEEGVRAANGKLSEDELTTARRCSP